MQATKKFRVQLDALIQGAFGAKKSEETTLAWRSLQLAKAWLGKSLQYLGEPSPYTVASTPDAIPPTADTAPESFILTENHLADINALRSAIQSSIDAITANRPTEPNQRHCWDKCLHHLAEARFWYGFELQGLHPIEVPTEPTLFDQLPTEEAISASLIEDIPMDEFKEETSVDPFMPTPGEVAANAINNEDSNRQENTPPTSKKKGFGLFR